MLRSGRRPVPLFWLDIRCKDSYPYEGSRRGDDLRQTGTHNLIEFDDGLDCYSMEVLLLHARAKHIRAECLNSNRNYNIKYKTISGYYQGT